MAQGELTSKQARFAEEFLVDSNATQAAMRAGYSARTAHQQGYQLLQKPAVQAAISAKRQELSHKTGVTAERTVRELAHIGFLDPMEAVDQDGRPRSLRDMPEDVRRAVAGIDVQEHYEGGGGKGEEPILVRTHKVRFWAKPTALKMLGDHLQLFGAGTGDEAVRGIADRLDKALARLESRA